MICLSRRELYALFIESDWWRELSYRKRSSCGFICNRCHKKDHCQAHHTHYPENWFDTTLDDLECLCFDCHQLEHGKCKPVEVQAVPSERFTCVAEVLEARSHLRITREEFEFWKRKFQARKLWNPRRKRKNIGRRKYRQPKRLHVPEEWNHPKVAHMNIYVRHHWVNRGTSSN